jgi:hypothetical protein
MRVGEERYDGGKFDDIGAGQPFIFRFDTPARLWIWDVARLEILSKY